MGWGIFVSYVQDRLTRPMLNQSQDMGVAIALYFVYPAILWLLIDKFHGICGSSVYAEKRAAVAACNKVFIPFTVLLRTHKIGTIVLFQTDASMKRDEGLVEENRRTSSRDVDDDDDDACTWLKCRVWCQLTQELTGILFVSFLLLTCLPVLAFWSMFLGILITCGNIYFLLRRFWKDAHSGLSEDGVWDATSREGELDDLEFQEFLRNFTDRDGSD